MEIVFSSAEVNVRGRRTVLDNAYSTRSAAAMFHNTAVLSSDGRTITIDRQADTTLFIGGRSQRSTSRGSRVYSKVSGSPTP